MLELRDVVKHYSVGDDTIRAIDGVSLTVARGQLVALYGPSGSGKTTLLNLISGAARPDAGQILIEGCDLDEFSPDEMDEYRLKRLGIIGQPGDLIRGWRAIDSASLKLWLSDASEDTTHSDRMEQMSRRLGLSDRMRHRTEQLSMGERQRVMMLQALVTDPWLVLADEPTGTLDPQRTISVLELLQSESHEKGRAIILVTHDPAAADFADTAHALVDGRLVPYAPPTQSYWSRR